MCEVRTIKNIVCWYHVISKLSMEFCQNYHPRCYKFWQKFKILTEIQVLGTLIYHYFHYFCTQNWGPLQVWCNVYFNSLRTPKTTELFSQSTLAYCHFKLVPSHPWIKIIPTPAIEQYLPKKTQISLEWL